MNRRRLPENRDLPTGLCWDKTHGYWVLRFHGKRKTFRGSRVQAIDWANDIKASIPSTNPNRVHTQIDRYLADIDGHLSPETVRERRRIARWYKSKIHYHYTMPVVTRQYLNEQWESLTAHAKRQHRNFWVQVFDHAISEGACEVNEAKKTKRPRVPKRRRERLTVENYERIYRIAPMPLQIAMEIAVSTMLRLKDIEDAKKADIEDGAWTLTHSKTGKQMTLVIPPGSRADKAIRRAKGTPVMTPYLIPWRPVLGPPRKALSKAFTRCAREVGTTATFHELKSLGQSLYEMKYGVTHAIQLAQWSDEKMAEVYREGREIPVVEAGL